MSPEADNRIIRIKQKLNLLADFAVREVRSKHQGTAFGIVWMLLTPCFLLAIYTFVFGIVFGRSFNRNENETIYDYAIGLFIGISIYQLFSSAVAAAPHAIISRSSFVKKVRFPLEILPISSTLAACIASSVSILIAIVLAFIEHQNLSLQHLLIIPIITAGALYSASISLILSAISVYLRDITQIGSLLNLGLMFASGVFYLPEDIPPDYYDFLKYNPIIPLIHNARKIILWNEPADPAGILFLNIAGVAALALSLRIFSFLKRSFADAL